MSSNAVVWDADEYDQFNPVYTDMDGCYAWDVPEGFWQVKFEKDGYEVAYSEWLPVPPPQLDVNVKIVSQSAPELLLINAFADAVELAFTQYVDVETVNSETVQLKADGKTVDGTWEAISPEPAADDASLSLATAFRFIPKSELSGSLSYTIHNVQNYVGQTIESQSGTLPIKLEIKSIQVPDRIELAYNMSKTISIVALPQESVFGKQISFSCDDSYLVEVDDSADFDESGIASFSATSILPGTTTIRYEIEGTTFTGEILVISTMETEATYTVTVINGSGSGEYAAGEPVTITAGPSESGKHFLEWTGLDDLTFTSGGKTTETAVFIMPSESVRIEAVFEDDVPAWQIEKENSSTVSIQCEEVDAGGYFLFAIYDVYGQFLKVEKKNAAVGSTIFTVTAEKATAATVFWVDNDYKPIQPSEVVQLK